MIGGAKGIGLGIDLGLVNQYNRTGSQSYIEPEVLDSLVGVWSAYGMTNDSPNRSTIKNKLSNKGGDFVINNAAFKLNSGFGKYSADFESFDWAVNISQKQHNKATISLNGRLCNHTAIEVDEMKVNIIGNVTELIYWYIANPDDTTRSEIRLTSGINTLPKSYAKDDGQTYNIGFAYISGDSEITIEQIPSFEGAFVTDGIDDLITSTKTVSEMGVTNEITIISMIHQINLHPTTTSVTNDIRVSSSDGSLSNGRNVISAEDKTGIYGWSRKNSTISVVNNILGDKNDYTAAGEVITNYNNKISVVGTADNRYTSSVAWYWTVIANKVLTTDQINQVIAYFNLDRTLRPDILCNITKQGITNDNHADFNDKLVDYSGNGRDIQMYNLAWKGSSGVAAKKFETIKDYLIVPDEGLQELTIYNEFSYKVKSIKYADRYWTVQSLNKTDVSYPITIIADKDIIWRNILNYTDENGVKGSIRKGTNVPANVPTQIQVLGFNDFDVPDNYTKVNCVSYATRTDITEFTVTFIPSYKGGILLDGINDFGKVTGMPIYKDYTFIIDYERISYISSEVWTASVVSKAHTVGQGAFILMLANREVELSRQSNSFGSTTTFNRDDFTRTLLYQSKYKCGDVNLTVGEGIDGDTLWLGTLRDNDYRFFNGAIYSLMSFPYSMSEFLIERQLKKHKLGTLYPDMVEFRPVIKANANYNIFYTALLPLTGIVWEKINIGDYIPVGRRVAIQLSFDNEASELVSAISSQLGNISITKNSNNKGYTIFGDILKNKSPQKINITIDEYIRYEDIVQPYPVLLRFNDENGNEVSWGGKFRVGSTITRIGSIADPESNLLNGLYSISGLSFNGKPISSSTSIVEKQMVFRTTATWLLDNNEPKVILSPSRLRIPNSSYKLLGYIPDISGHGNHGKINNSAYAEGSGVNEDGSYQLDGVDDHITIPTLSSGGKQVLMKVNWNTINSIIYDQRGSGGFAIYCSDYNNPSDSITVPAYKGRNAAGTTYIDGIRNEYIIASQLRNVTHNIVEILDTSYAAGNINPIIGKSNMNANYGSLALYDFMFFDNISTEDKIKQLNEYVGIEAKVELPPYYWDAYGKTNLDADKATIQQRGVAVGDYDLTNTNFAYDKMSGFGGYTLGKFTNSWSLGNNNNSISIVARNPYDITLKKLGGNSDWEFNTTELKIISNPVSVKFKSDKNIRFTCDYHYYTVGGNSEGAPLGITSKDLIANEDTIITISSISQENIDKYNIDINRGYYLIYFQLSPTLEVNEEVTIEMLPLYPNGLVYDGITDYSENANIPALTDFTVIAKRVWMNKDNPMNECFIHKGVVSTPISESALMLEYEIGNDTYYRSSSYGGYINIERSNRPEIITYQTTESYNGISIIKGSGIDTQGLVVGAVTNNYWKGVFYKLILYPKTIPLLQINFLKNLMERDEIIDLNNPIFIQE